MSRNIGATDCYFCDGPVEVTGDVHPITKAEANGYFDEFEGLLVADAVCKWCVAKYLAWIDCTHCKQEGLRDRGAKLDACGKFLPFDISFRSTFDDEPGSDDMPGYVIVTERRRLCTAGVSKERFADIVKHLRTSDEYREEQGVRSQQVDLCTNADRVLNWRDLTDK